MLGKKGCGRSYVPLFGQPGSPKQNNLALKITTAVRDSTFGFSDIFKKPSYMERNFRNYSSYRIAILTFVQL